MYAVSIHQSHTHRLRASALTVALMLGALPLAQALPPPSALQILPGTVQLDGAHRVAPSQALRPRLRIDPQVKHSAAGDNRAIDATLEKFASENTNNPKAMAALEGAASEIKQNPAAYLNPDGSVNEKALADLVTRKFAGAGEVTIPTPDVGNAGVSYNNLAGIGDQDIMALAFIVMMEASKSAREDLKAIMDGVKAINKQKEGWRQVSSEVNKLAADATGRNDDFAAAQISGIANDSQNNLNGKPIGAYVLDGKSLRVNTPGDEGSTGNGGLVISGSGPDGTVTKKDIDTAKETVKNKLDSLSEMGETESLRLQMAMDRLSKLMSTLSNLLKKTSDTDSGITQNIK